MTNCGSYGRASEPILARSPSLTQVCVLVRDKAGRAPVVCKTFSHVEPAEAFIQERLASGTRQGFLVFWTLAHQPAKHDLAHGQQAEVMVLVPESGADTVLQFALPDVTAARAFVLREFPGRDASISWALPISVATDARGNVTLSPSAPPQGSTEELSAPAQDDNEKALTEPNQQPSDDPRDADMPPTPLTIEVRKVLAVKRWEFVPGSFAGFGSPPGRF